MNEWEVVNELKNNNTNTNTKDDELKYILLKEDDEYKKEQITEEIKKEIKKEEEEDNFNLNKIVSKLMELLPYENKYFCIKILQINNFDIINTLVWLLNNRFTAFKIRRRMASMDRKYSKELRKKYFILYESLLNSGCDSFLNATLRSATLSSSSLPA